MVDEKKKQTIFIVEDDVDLCEMLTAYFRVQGYDVKNANRGEDAVTAIQEVLPDLAVLDIRLPDIDGFEVCRKMREGRRTQNIPVIFLTEKREQTDIYGGLQLGAVDYITKPFDIQELRLRVRNALKRTQLTNQFNPVTTLPEGSIVSEQLDKLLGQPDWGVVYIQMGGLTAFRDKYGFVAADDVTRAVSVMIGNALKDAGSPDDFIGHTNSHDYVILTTAGRQKRLADRCRMRLQPSIQYFYPALDRNRVKLLPEAERLSIQVSSMSAADNNPSEVRALIRTVPGWD
ncbi:MAG: response regulator transcription factor [Ardenticatenaceae bacterium]|nr:response regulator transcription factor [Ardenticatenaceae bacterium]